MTVKFRFKAGDMELEFEGSESFLKERLPSFLKSLEEKASVLTKRQSSHDSSTNLSNSGGGPIRHLTTKSIAAKLLVKKGPDFVRAACAKLVLVDNKKELERGDILKEMQSASGYYKKVIRQIYQTA